MMKTVFLRKQWFDLQDEINSNQTTTCSTLAQQKRVYTSFSHSHLDIEGLRVLNIINH
jgi:hypothetical protein